MKRIKILTRRKALNEKEKKLEKKRLKVKAELEELTQKCKHEVIIQLDDKKSVPGKESYCLFCKKSYPISNGIIIKMNDYEFLNEEIVENMYKTIREEYTEDTEWEIAMKLVDKLEEYKKQ